MTTLDDMTNEVELNLLGVTADQESITPLVGTMNSSAVSFTVTDATQVSTGLIEVDDELMWCSEVDPDANVVYVSIRGMYGTTPAAHTASSFVRNNPRYPRVQIKKAINDTLRSVYPDVFAVASTTLTATPVAVTYQLPADVEQVLDVVYQLNDLSREWYPVKRYQVNMNANSGAFPTGKSIDIWDAVLGGQTINIVYRKVPSALSAGTDLLTDTGLEDSAKECIVYGACARLVGYAEPSRFTDDSAEAKFMGLQPAGAAMNASRFFYQMHLQTRAEETRRLLDRYPPRIHFRR